LQALASLDLALADLSAASPPPPHKNGKTTRNCSRQQTRPVTTLSKLRPPSIIPGRVKAGSGTKPKPFGKRKVQVPVLEEDATAQKMRINVADASNTQEILREVINEETEG